MKRVELVLALPGLAVAVAVTMAMAARALAIAPFEPGTRVTLAEAAALEDEADVVRLIRAGADPNAPSFVRRTRTRAVARQMTPLEAAVTSRHVSVMRLLLASGALVDDRNDAVLWCFAEARRNRDVLGLLRAQLRREPPADCSAVPIPQVQP